MSLLEYQNLKPSGVEYLDETPNDWPLKRLGDLVGFAQGKPHEPYIDDDGDYICVNSRFISTLGKTIKTCSVNLTPASLDDILMVMSDLPNGRALARAYYVDDHGKYAVNQRVCRITVEKAFPRFLFYLLDRHPGLMQNDDGVHQTHLSNADFQKLKLYLPSISEQTKIARFLDHETAHIDALIEEQHRLIELLKEKRLTVISHAVTKGLNPTAPTKDSGVEWLGKVPAHWPLPKLGHLARVLNGSTPSRENMDYWSDGDIPWVASGSLNDYRIDLASEFITKKALKECSVEMIPRGAILVGLVGQGRTRGLAALLNIEATINQNVCAVVPDEERVLSGYLHLYLHCIYEPMRDFGRGANQAALNCELVSALRIPLPCLKEQNRIVNYIENKLNDFDALEDYAQRSIDLMQERRSALILAAVTGKIDVRGWQPLASAPSSELEQEAV